MSYSKLPSFSNEAQSKHNLDYLLGRVIWFILYGIILVAFVDGYFIEKVGFNRVQSIYYVLMLIPLLMYFIVRPKYPFWLGYLLVLLSVLWVGSIFSGGDSGRLIEDTRYFLRSYLLGFLVYHFFSTFSIKSRDIQRFFFFQWVLVTVLVLCHFFLGIGGTSNAHGEIRSIYSSYFKEGNVIAFFYVCVWFYLYCYYQRGMRIIVTCFTLVVGILLSSKAAILGVLLLLSFHWIAYFKQKSKARTLLVNSILIFLFAGVVFFLNEILSVVLDVFVSVLPDSAQMVAWLKNWDALTILTSTRDLQVLDLIHRSENFPATTWLFGVGFDAVLKNELLIESDIFDIFQAFGVIGLILFMLPVVALLFYIRQDKTVLHFDMRLWIFSLGIVYINVFISTFTGHVLLTPTPIILLGLVAGRWIYIRKHAKPCWRKL